MTKTELLLRYNNSRKTKEWKKRKRDKIRRSKRKEREKDELRRYQVVIDLLNSKWKVNFN